MLAIRLPDDIETRLSELAKATGRTKSYYAREAIVNYLDDLEDYYLVEKAEEEMRKGNMMFYSLADVEKALGLDN